MKSYKDIVEALKGKQHKLDVDKDGKIEGEDLAKLRSMKKEETEIEEGLKPEHNMRPGWMLKADPELAAKVKKNKDIAQARKSSYGNPDAGKTVKEEKDLDTVKEETQEQFKVGDFVKDHTGKIHRVFGVNGTNLETGIHYGKDKYGGTNNLHTSKAKKVPRPQDVKEESEERMSRSDYKVASSGRKSHKEIVFKHGESDKKDLEEGKMTDAEMKKREEIVKSMKKNMAGFKDRYGDRAKEVMYATATKMAMKEETVKEAVQKADIPAYLRKQQGQTPLKLSDLKRKDTISDKENLAKLRNEETKYVVHYTNEKGEHVNSSKAFDDKAKADAHASKGNAMDKVGGKYTVKTIQNEEKPPFDGPYTKVKGDVKDKSGAVHTPASRAKHLARMAMKKQMKEDIDRLFEKDDNEYNYEGEMAVTQLKTIMRHAEALQAKMQPDTNLPEWVQSKITLAADYIQTASDYLHSEIEEQAPVAPVPGQKWKDHAVMVNGKQRVVIKRSNAKNYPEHEGWKEVSPGQKLKEEDEAQFSYTELMMMLEYESKSGVYRHTGSYGSDYAKKEREKDEIGFDAEDKPTTSSTQKRGRGRPAGSKSGARGPRIK